MMKRKHVGLLLAAALVVCQPVSAFASGSIGAKPSIPPSTSNDVGGNEVGSGGGGGGSSSRPGSGSAGQSGQSGQSVGVVGASNGAATVGDTQISLASGVAATAGLPAEVVSSINSINAGAAALDQVTGCEKAAGYSALSGVQAVIAKDATTKEAKTGEVPVTLSVPNLVPGLTDVQVLFYNNATGLWDMLTPTKVDPVTKQISVNIAGSGSFTIVYKK